MVKKIKVTFEILVDSDLTDLDNINDFPEEIACMKKQFTEELGREYFTTLFATNANGAISEAISIRNFSYGNITDL